MNTNVYIAVVILVCAVCTFSERLFPFLIFGKHKVPRVVRYLGKVLPMAIMMALVVYCLRGTQFTSLAAAHSRGGDGRPAPLEAQHAAQHRGRHGVLYGVDPRDRVKRTFARLYKTEASCCASDWSHWHSMTLLFSRLPAAAGKLNSF